MIARLLENILVKLSDGSLPVVSIVILLEGRVAAVGELLRHPDPDLSLVAEEAVVVGEEAVAPSNDLKGVGAVLACFDANFHAIGVEYCEGVRKGRERKSKSESESKQEGKQG